MYTILQELVRIGLNSRREIACIQNICVLQNYYSIHEIFVEPFYV
jgi:hypothetical protein